MGRGFLLAIAAWIGLGFAHYHATGSDPGRGQMILYGVVVVIVCFILAERRRARERAAILRQQEEASRQAMIQQHAEFERTKAAMKEAILAVLQERAR